MRVDATGAACESSSMKFAMVFEQITGPEFPPGHYYCHVPTLGLTTHGLGIEGARDAAIDLVSLWIAEKKANGENISGSAEILLSTVEVPDHALQVA